MHARCAPDGERVQPSVVRVSFLVPRDALSSPSSGDADASHGGEVVRADLHVTVQARSSMSFNHSLVQSIIHHN